MKWHKMEKEGRKQIVAGSKAEDIKEQDHKKGPRLSVIEIPQQS